MDPGASKEDEHKIYGQQDEDPLTQERIREEKCPRIRQNPREEMPERECEWNAEAKRDQPGRDVEALDVVAMSGQAEL